MRNTLRRSAHLTIYQVTDRLHEGRTVFVPGPAIPATVSAWLAELGVDSPLVGDLGDAIRAGDWPTAHGIASYLAVEVVVAA
jgi:hypothetical protein